MGVISKQEFYPFLIKKGQLLLMQFVTVTILETSVNYTFICKLLIDVRVSVRGREVAVKCLKLSNIRYPKTTTCPS